MKTIWRVVLPAFFFSVCSVSHAQTREDLSPLMLKTLKQSIAQSSSFADRFDAEVWLIDMSGRIANLVDDRLERIEILKAVHAQASINQLPTDVVLGLIETESHFNRYALSPAGAQGLMQIMPFWKLEIGRPMDNLIDIETNIRYGCTILKSYLNIEKGDMSKALARYNGSRGKAKYPNKVFKNRAKYMLEE